MVSFFIFFWGLTTIESYTLNGQFNHTYGEPQTYFILIFFSLSYILIDSGLQLANAEIRFYIEKKRRQLLRLKAQEVQKD